VVLNNYARCKFDCTCTAGILLCGGWSRLTEQRGPDSPGGRAGSARQTSSSSVSRDRRSSSTSPQPQLPQPAAAAAAGPSSTSTGGDETSSASRSPNHPAGASANYRFPAAAALADAHPQRTGSYHGDFHRTNRNRFSDSPLRTISLDAAGRVRARTSCYC